MTAKEYLEQIEKKNDVINNLIMEKDELYLGASGSGKKYYYVAPVQTSPERDRFGRLFGQIEEKEKEIDRAIDELVDLRAKIVDQINALGGKKSTLLYLRYVKLMQWSEIGPIVGWKRAAVYRNHEDALNDFADKYGLDKIDTCRKSSNVI